MKELCDRGFAQKYQVTHHSLWWKKKKNKTNPLSVIYVIDKL